MTIETSRIVDSIQGHSTPVDVELPLTEPQEYLYNGTGQKYVKSIDRAGLIPKSRSLHLSADPETAVKVGSRHGKPVVYRIRSSQVQKDGCVFYRSVNGVWLAKEVSVKYLEKA